VADRSNWTTRKYKLGEEPLVDEEVRAMTPGQRIEMVWEITAAMWELHDPDALRAGFRRDVARVIRRRG
jgi:hypothetical protein